jgi:uncharacterized membrane protein HdeD (DUF308 family)
MPNGMAVDTRSWTSGWWLLLLIGVLCVVAGVIVLLKPSDSLATLAVVAGIFVLVDGAFELAAAIAGATTNRGLVAILGILSVIVGVLLIRHPIAGVAAIALLIGIWLIAIGVLRFVASFELAEHRAWSIVVAVVEVIAGIAIVASPDIGFATLAVLVGLAFIVKGVAMCALGWEMRRVRGALTGGGPA